MSTFATVVFVLLFLGVPMALLTRDLFRQIAPHKDSTTHSAQRSQGRPVPTRVPAQTEQWTALDDVHSGACCNIRRNPARDPSPAPSENPQRQNTFRA